MVRNPRFVLLQDWALPSRSRLRRRAERAVRMALGIHGALLSMGVGSAIGVASGFAVCGSLLLG